MGQAFRWQPLGDGWFSGVLGENLVHIGQPDGVDGAVFYRIGGRNGERPATSIDDKILRRYFREDDDVTKIYSDISSRDPVMSDLVHQYHGMRVLRQAHWECIVSYICSANNSIKGISRCVEAISEEFGEPVLLAGEIRPTFPSPEQLAEATERRLRELKLGFRAPRVALIAKRVADSRTNFANFNLMHYQNAKTRLKQYDGIGDKIADCIALMSLGKLEAFPVDTHIRKMVNERWFGYDKPPSDSMIVEWAQDYFGPYAGYAGQFIFCDREQAGNHASSIPSRTKVRDTAKSESGKFEGHRARRCPFCGVPPGTHCKTPGGHYLLEGHKDRRSQSRRTTTSTRRRSQTRRAITRARPRRSP